MKLSPANLSKTLQNIKPMRKLSGKLKRAIGKRGVRKGSTNSTAKPNSAKTSEIPGFIQNSKLVQNSKGARVAFHLLLVKPWVLVVGLWLVSALSAVVAIEGLVSPSKLTKAIPEPAVEVVPVAKTNSFIDVEQSAEGLTDDGNETEASAPDASEVVAANSRLPVWPLVTLVGSCAAGCVVISRRRAMLRIAAARARGKGRKPQTAKTQNAPTRLKASNSNPTRRTASAPSTLTPVTVLKSTARLVAQTSRDQTKDKGRDKLVEKTATYQEKKRRQRNRSSPQQTAIKPAGKSRVLASRSNAQQAAPQSRVSQPKRPQRPSQKVTRLVRRQPVVSVVPANHANRLDWVEGSLAHDMDRRFSMEEASKPRRVS
ncbi:MAG: hypothetical protein DCF25_10695 [Leptolyngbya foveolarum]|uniref:Transmembrane protein n=1 Tax=Leptolyngbya foveolarum TaxID=47253 RepID=A0A2W4VZV0_9CYAN|nr:MAG: hypothetical protein DCF25_10695 [Leptolyngbya foveolarum]